MRLEQYDSKAGRKVWLDRAGVDALLARADTTAQTIAFALMARCGLRADEAASVTPPDLVDTDVGPRVRVESGKGDKFREVPVPGDLKTTIDVYARERDAGPDTPLVDVSTRSLRRWVSLAADELRAETKDDGWQYLGPHDLRRTWGTLLVEAGVEPGMIMAWGGWDDWQTFRRHYLGAYSPEMERRQAALVPWLPGRRDESAQRRDDAGPSRADPHSRGRESGFQNGDRR